MNAPPPRFLPGNPLEEALLAASERDDLGLLLSALRDHEVLVPTVAPTGIEGSEPLPEGTEISLRTFEREGRTYLPVFTSEAQLDLAAPGQSYVRLTGQALVGLWPAGTAMAVNPGGDLGVAIPEEAVRGLLEADEGGVAEVRIGAGSEIVIGAPDPEPEGLTEVVGGLAEQRPDVLAVHRALVQVQGQDERPQLVLGLELAPGTDPDSECRAWAEALGEGVGLMAVAGGSTDPVARWMLEQDEPLFTRS